MSFFSSGRGIHFISYFLTVLVLAACSGMGGGASAPGASGAGTYEGGALDSGPAALNSPNQAAGGVLSAPADDELLGNCDIWTFLFYGKELDQQFGSSEDLPWPVAFGSPFAETFLIRSISDYPMELQVRVFHVSADGNAVRYKDYNLTNAGATGAKLTVEVEGAANGDRIQILIPHGIKSPLESGEETCVYLKDKNFKPEWTPSNPEELKKNLGNRVRIAGFVLQIEVPALPVAPGAIPPPGLDTLSE
ncbi:MAG TPA: hypothetical protein VFW62_06265 [bacterium]|nr:hypothetical protein [bacterium]